MDEKIKVENIEKNGKTKERDLFEQLKNKITTDRDIYRNQLRDIKDKLEKNKKDHTMLETLRDKLEGAVEVSDGYLKSVLPPSSK